MDDCFNNTRGLVRLTASWLVHGNTSAQQGRSHSMQADRMGDNPEQIPLRRARLRHQLALVVIALAGLCSAPALAGETELTALLAKKSAILARMHKKARKALVNAAQDKAFVNYFVATEPQARTAAKQTIQQVTLNVQSDFHVEEMCLIAPTGKEITRIVGNRIAPDSELSPDETMEIFFEPGFATNAKRVYVSPPYMSHDAHRWVVAYVTPVAVDGETRAILHYEHDLDSYQQRLNRDIVGSNLFVLALTEDGYVISDSREPLSITKQGHKEALGDYFVRVESIADDDLKTFLSGIGESREGSATFADNSEPYSVAFKKLDHGWMLLAIEKL